MPLTFDEARELVATQLLPGNWPKGWPAPVVRDTGLEGPNSFRVFVDRSDGDEIMDPPVILVEKETGHVHTLVGPTVVLSAEHDTARWPKVRSSQRRSPV